MNEDLESLNEYLRRFGMIDYPTIHFDREDWEKLDLNCRRGVGGTCSLVLFWSGRRDSNPRLQPWQGCALPLSYAR